MTFTIDLKPTLPTQFPASKFAFNPFNADIFKYKLWRPKVFFQFSEMSQSSLFTSFEYLYYGFTAIIHIFSVPLTDFRRRNLTSMDVRFCGFH